MKRIAIFCDGTWNRSDAMHPTNVVKLAQAARRTADDGMKQAIFYVEGVGTGKGTTRFARAVDRFAGGALGWGLLENIRDAYRALVFAYEPGDEIYIFGFSRGAYTARSLAGLIRSTGMASPEMVHRIPKAILRYRSPDPATKPDTEESFRFRAEISPSMATSQKEVGWRRQHDLEGELFRLSYLGVWDTVGALGVPSHFKMLAKLFNQKYDFHDTALSSSVAAARHAVSIDENRATFPPALWENLGSLNQRFPRKDGTSSYEQLWFPGDHGSVGGGGDIVGLSNEALGWIAGGAERAGLQFEASVLEEFRREANYRVALQNMSQPSGGFFDWLTKLKKRPRLVPTGDDVLAPATVRRWREPAENLSDAEPYRPSGLRRNEGMISIAELG